MGWTVLYIAFGVVALWLLSEVLLQYKARLRWRLLAFGGFLCVVAGAVLPSIIVIGVGIAAFATGQTFVTLSHRRGFEAGWALSSLPGGLSRLPGLPGSDRPDRPGRGGEPAEEGPAPEAARAEAYEPSYAEAGPYAPQGADDPYAAYAAQAGVGQGGLAQEAGAGDGYAYGYDTPGYVDPGHETSVFEPVPGYGTGGYGTGGYDTGGYGADGYGPQDVTPEPVPVYQPGPMPDETAEFSVFEASRNPWAGVPSGEQDAYTGQPDPYQPAYGAYAYQGQDQQYAYPDPYSYSGASGYAGYPGYDQSGQYAAASHGEHVTGGYGHDGYGAGGYSHDGYGHEGYGHEGYANPYGGVPYDQGGTYAGGPGDNVWVPQQRGTEGEPYPAYQQPQPQPQPQEYDYGQEQYQGYGAQGGYYYDDQRGGGYY